MIVKKLLIIAAAVAGVFSYWKAQESKARKSIWSTATDKVV
ncbi:DLW-39 family protein [Pseudarthrobacter sp. PS3-L1]|nr:DLW-39 family protein [Pseudarthrobacter sp. PS3-L1]MDJ0320960.1 DLW-39 family protein [Pseudarthrobacter sp. PS3-L1]